MLLFLLYSIGHKDQWEQTAQGFEYQDTGIIRRHLEDGYQRRKII